jgi:Rod binding domain-containing protein
MRTVANSPPDIVLGVALAADPQKYRVAAERLRRMSAEAATGAAVPTGVSSAAVQASPTGVPENPTAVAPSGPPRLAPVSPRQPRNPADAFGQLEAFVLQTFIQSMLPKNAQHVFGKGTAGEVWKSMLAEKLGSEIARSGQLGIAKRLASARVELAASRPGAPSSGAATLPQLPSASVAGAFLAAQGEPRQANQAAETIAPQPTSSAEQS